MAETNLDLLKLPVKTLVLAGKSIEIKELVLNKALIAQEKWIKANNLLINRVNKLKKEKTFDVKNLTSDEIIFYALSDKKFDKEYTKTILDVCLYIIKEPFGFKNFKNWYKTRGLTKNWLMNNASPKQITKFIEEVIGLIIGEENKKKVEELGKKLMHL